MKKNISIIYFDNDTPKDEINMLCKSVKKVVGKDVGVIALPKNFDLILECSTDQLLQVRAMIDTALSLKIDELEEEQESVINYDNSILPC